MRPLNDTCIGGSFCAYQTNASLRMGTDAGLAWLAQRRAALLELQAASLRPQPLRGDLVCSGCSCAIRTALAAPSVVFFEVDTEAPAVLV